MFSRIPARAGGMGLTATDWAVLHVICLHADKAGHAYPSLMRIAGLACIRRNHVSRSTKRLEQLGLLRSARLPRGSGWANTRYEVAFDGVAPETGASEVGVAPEVVLGGTSSGTTGSTSDGALTYHLTDQGTDLTRKGEVEEGVGKAGGGTSVGSTSNPAQPCTWYLTNSTGYRLCGKPAVADGHCAMHASNPHSPGLAG